METGYQLYSSRNFGPLEDTLKMLANLGYARVEGFGALFESEASKDALQRGLAETGLKMPTGHFGLEMVENNPEKVIETAR